MRLLALGVVSLAAGYGLLRSYVHSDAFRKFLSVESGRALGAIVEFAPFDWNGLAVDTASFEAKGEGTITNFRASGVHSEIGLGAMTQGVWKVCNSSVNRVDVFLTLDGREWSEEKSIAKTSRTANERKSLLPSCLPNKLELRDLKVDELAINAQLKDGLAMASGITLKIEQADSRGTYEAKIKGGIVRLPNSKLSELHLSQARLKYQASRVSLVYAHAAIPGGGNIQAAGEWDTGSSGFSLEGDASDFKCDDVFSEDWAKRLTGDVASNFIVDNRANKLSASGKMTITNGSLTALPVLDALAAYADTARFRTLSLSEAHTEWRWTKDEIVLNQLVLTSDGLMRLEGRLVIRGQELDGIFRLGLVPNAIAAIPGAESGVFTAGDHGLMWTPLRISGTLANPEEDLTARLIAAAGLRLLDQIPETGEQVIKFTRSALTDPPIKTIDKGIKIIGEGGKAVESAAGFLNGVFGAGQTEEPNQ